MTNTIALGLGLVVLGLLAADTIWYGTEHLYFIARKMIDLIEWLAFWR